MFLYMREDEMNIRWLTEPLVKKPISPEEKEGAKAGLGLQYYLDLTWLVWDVRSEHQARRWLQQSEKKVLLWPINELASSKLFLVGKEIAEKNAMIVSDYRLHVAADRMICFRKSEYEYSSRIPTVFPDD